MFSQGVRDIPDVVPGGSRRARPPYIPAARSARPSLYQYRCPPTSNAPRPPPPGPGRAAVPGAGGAGGIVDERRPPQ